MQRDSRTFANRPAAVPSPGGEGQDEGGPKPQTNSRPRLPDWLRIKLIFAFSTRVLAAALMLVLATDALAQVGAPVSASSAGTNVDPSGKFVPAVSNADTNRARLNSAGAETALKQALNVQQTGSNTFQIGRVEFDKKNRTVILPAWINMRTQILEYALVTKSGKVHESLLATDASPSDVQLAFLLLGATPVDIGGAFNKAVAVPASNAVTIEVSWETNGLPKKYPLSELIELTDHRTNQPPPSLARGEWFYNGSRFDGMGFMAQREGSIISLIRDAAALVNNPRSDRDNDDLHVPNDKVLPPLGWPVRVIFSLPKPAVISIPPVKNPGVTPITPLSTNAP